MIGATVADLNDVVKLSITKRTKDRVLELKIFNIITKATMFFSLFLDERSLAWFHFRGFLLS